MGFNFGLAKNIGCSPLFYTYITQIVECHCSWTCTLTQQRPTHCHDSASVRSHFYTRVPFMHVHHATVTQRNPIVIFDKEKLALLPTSATRFFLFFCRPRDRSLYCRCSLNFHDLIFQLFHCDLLELCVMFKFCLCFRLWEWTLFSR